MSNNKQAIIEVILETSMKYSANRCSVEMFEARCSALEARYASFATLVADQLSAEEIQEVKDLYFTSSDTSTRLYKETPDAMVGIFELALLQVVQ